jgi:hypothetical protein
VTFVKPYLLSFCGALHFMTLLNESLMNPVAVWKQLHLNQWIVTTRQMPEERTGLVER